MQKNEFGPLGFYLPPAHIRSKIINDKCVYLQQSFFTNNPFKKCKKENNIFFVVMFSCYPFTRAAQRYYQKWMMV